MNSIELFAGGGGLALGLHEAGFSPVAIVERDGDSCQTLRENWRGAMGANFELFDNDIRAVDLRNWQDKLALISGGPPCQPFSIGGKHGGFHDERDMFPHAVHAVRTVRPKAFIFENVRGLLRKSFAKYFSYVLLQLQYPEITRRSDETWMDHLAVLEKHHTAGGDKGLRYRVVFQRINAADFGVPQNRERVVIVGFRWDIQEPWSFPSITHSQDGLESAQLLTGTYWDEHHISRAQGPPPMRRFDADRNARPVCHLQRGGIRSEMLYLDYPILNLQRQSGCPITDFSQVPESIPATLAASWTGLPKRLKLVIMAYLAERTCWRFQMAQFVTLPSERVLDCKHSPTGTYSQVLGRKVCGR